MKFVNEAVREILACTLLDADLAATDIAERTGLPIATVQYQLQQLREGGYVVPRACIDVHQVGLAYYGIFFTLAPDAPAERTLQSFAKHPSIAFLSEYVGGVRFGAAIFARSAASALHVFSGIIQRTNASVIKKSTATRTALYEIPRRYLSSRSYSEPFQISGLCEGVERLTENEQRILEFLAVHPVVSYREAARSLGMAHTTLAQRLKSLRERRIFLGRIYALESSLLGVLTYKLLVYTRGYDAVFVQSLRRIILTHPHATHFVEAYGEWDFEITIEVFSPEDASAFVELLHSHCAANIVNILTLQVVKNWKRQFFPGGAKTTGDP